MSELGNPLDDLYGSPSSGVGASDNPLDDLYPVKAPETSEPEEEGPGIINKALESAVGGLDVTASTLHGLSMFFPTLGAMGIGQLMGLPQDVAGAFGKDLGLPTGKELATKFGEAAGSVTLAPGAIEEAILGKQGGGREAGELLGEAFHLAVPTEQIEHNLARMKELGVPEGIADQVAFWVSRTTELAIFHGYHGVGKSVAGKMTNVVNKLEQIRRTRGDAAARENMRAALEGEGLTELSTPEGRQAAIERMKSDLEVEAERPPTLTEANQRRIAGVEGAVTSTPEGFEMIREGLIQGEDVASAVSRQRGFTARELAKTQPIGDIIARKEPVRAGVPERTPAVSPVEEQPVSSLLRPERPERKNLEAQEAVRKQRALQKELEKAKEAPAKAPVIEFPPTEKQKAFAGQADRLKAARIQNRLIAENKLDFKDIGEIESYLEELKQNHLDALEVKTEYGSKVKDVVSDIEGYLAEVSHSQKDTNIFLGNLEILQRNVIKHYMDSLSELPQIPEFKFGKPAEVIDFLKEKRDAKSLREDEGRVREERVEREKGEGEGREDIQRQQEEGAKTRVEEGAQAIGETIEGWTRVDPDVLTRTMGRVTAEGTKDVKRWNEILHEEEAKARERSEVGIEEGAPAAKIISLRDKLDERLAKDLGPLSEAEFISYDRRLTRLLNHWLKEKRVATSEAQRSRAESAISEIERLDEVLDKAYKEAKVVAEPPSLEVVEGGKAVEPGFEALERMEVNPSVRISETGEMVKSKETRNAGEYHRELKTRQSALDAFLACLRGA